MEKTSGSGRGESDLIVAVARSGRMSCREAAFWWVMLYHSERGHLPVGTAIAPGVRARFRRRISQSSAYEGLDAARSVIRTREEADKLRDSRKTGIPPPVKPPPSVA